MEVNITARKLVVPVLVGLALVAGILVGRSSPAPAPARLDQRAPFGFSKVVFLSHVNTRSMPIFPGDPKVRLRPIFTVPDDGFRLQLMRIGEHTGTHWGSPCHFNLGEPCADELAARDFFLPAVVIDARRQTRRNVDYALTVRALRRFEARHGRIPKGAMVIMWTGFQGRWDKPKAYVNRKADGLLHYPGISKGATRWLISSETCAGLVSTRLEWTPASMKPLEPTRSCCATIASTSRISRTSGACNRTADGSLSGAFATAEARGRRPPSTDSFPSPKEMT